MIVWNRIKEDLGMASRKRNWVEEIVNKLRQAEVELGRGSSVTAACKAIQAFGESSR